MNTHLLNQALGSNYEFLLLFVDTEFDLELHQKNEDGYYERPYIWGLRIKPNPVIMKIIHGEDTLE